MTSLTTAASGPISPAAAPAQGLAGKENKSFHTSVRGRTGLDGFHAQSVQGPYRRLNGSGLVLANPDGAPHAQYAWRVPGDNRVVSFSNSPSSGPGPLRDDTDLDGTTSPFLRLRLNGESATLQADALGRAR